MNVNATEKKTILTNLEKEAAVLLGVIQIHESYLHQKSKELKIDRYDQEQLNEMIIKFLKILALIDAFQYFESINETLTNNNIVFFSFVVNNDFSFRIRKFIKDLIYY